MQTLVPSSFLLALGALAALAACKTHDDPGDGGPGGPSTGAPRVFLPTGDPDNTSAPRIAVDATGRIHAAYPAYAMGGAYYATCAGTCDSSDDFAVVAFDTDGSVENLMLALDAAGHPRVLMSAADKVYYAACDGDCDRQTSWSSAPILAHDGHRDVTGEAFALDAAGHPRFLVHTEVAYLGVGQRPPATDWMMCDSDCGDAASWRSLHLADQIWWQSSLAFDADGHPRMATVAHVLGDATHSTTDLAAFVACDADCDSDGSAWAGTGLMPAYVNDLAAVSIAPAVSLALTADGRPRVAVLGTDDDFHRRLTYFECDDACAVTESWRGATLLDRDDIGAGLDLALTGDDGPRLAYTLDFAIVLTGCDDARCGTSESTWHAQSIEAGREMRPDEIFLNKNCEVGAWFLHSPSLALDAHDRARVGYQARDISFSTNPHDPNDPDEVQCEAGDDMSWSRLAIE